METTRPFQQFLVSALVLALLGACSHNEQAANANKPMAVKVKLASVESRIIDQSSDFVASLQSRRSVTLQPRVEGQVSSIAVKPGDVVAAGTQLLWIDPEKQTATVNSSTAAAESAQADRDSATAILKTYEADRQSKLADLKFNQQQYDRYKTLFAQGAISQQDLDRYANSLSAARASLGAMNAQIEAQRAVITKTKQQWQQSQAGIQEQKAELQFYNITAPFAGTVGDIPVKVGDFVDKTAKLITITQNQPLEVNLSIPVDRASEVRQGSQIELLNDQNKVIGSSQVFFISPNVNDTTQSVLIKAAFENANNQLRANQFVRARVIWAKRPGILIPATAVSRIAGQEFVFVVESDGQTNSLVAKQKPVKLGTVQGNNYPVLEGLKAGEKIVVSGLLKLANNTPIAPES